MRKHTLFAVALVGLPITGLPAQSCLRARPLPYCRVFFLTNAGGYATPNRVGSGGSHFRVNADWGLMVNTGRRNAIGVSWFATLDQDGLGGGSAVRYRRWLNGPQSIDAALGVAVAEHLRRGSLLVKYNPSEWVGFAVSSEYVRRKVANCAMSGCTTRRVSSGRIYAGVELGSYAGLSISLVGGTLLVLVAMAVAGAD